MSDSSILTDAKEFFTLAESADADNRKAALDDFKFRAGDQWPEKSRRTRETDPDGPRPCLVMDKLNQYVNQIKNDQRQNRPSIKVQEADGAVHHEVAEIYRGLIRHIELQSRAALAYDTAFEQAVVGGMGCLRVRTVWDDPESFQQDLRIEPIANPFDLYLDPASTQLDGSDLHRAGVLARVSRSWLEKKFGKSRYYSDFMAKSHAADPDHQTITLADYYVRSYRETTIYLLPHGQVVEQVPVGMIPVQQRQAMVPEVWCYQLAGEVVLQKSRWCGRNLPIVPVYGNFSIDANGRRQYSGIIRTARDAQMAYNYAVSAFIEQVSLVPKAPYIAAADQIEQFENEWRMANIKNVAVLRYTPVPDAPPPMRQGGGDIPAGWVHTMAMAEKDIQASLGMYQASLGAPSNEKSGKAIMARQREGDTATFHYADNLHYSMMQLGRILVEAIPAIYDTRRVLRILGEDGDYRTITVDPAAPTPVHQERHPVNGEVIAKVFNLTVGKYDVTIDTGPSYTSKREAALDGMLQIVQAHPQLWAVAGDLLVANMDWPGADQLANRLAKTIPPQLRGDGPDAGEGTSGQDGPPSPPPQSPPPQMAQAMAMIQQLQQQLQMAKAQLEQVADKRQLEAKKLEIEQFNAVTERKRLLLASNGQLPLKGYAHEKD